MKRITTLLLFIFSFSVLFPQNSEVLNLNKNWSFSQKGKNDFYQTEIPTTVQNDLIRLGVLPNPFWKDNEKKIQWVEDKDWTYKTTFFITQKQLSYDAMEMIFEGLDTYAEVWLNGQKILFAKNMFVGYWVDVKKYLKKGQNRLVIHFFSPIKYWEKRREETGFEYPADNDHRKEKVSIYTRKAPYHFGWDWGTRMVQMGIWKPIKIHFYNTAKISDFFVQQEKITDKKAIINTEVEIFSLVEKKANLTVNYSFEKEQKRGITTPVFLKKGKNIFSVKQEIDNPKLWTPINWEKQHLYDFCAKIEIDKKIIDTKKRKIGLKNIRLVQQKDSLGRSFYFTVNEKPFFVRGANYIPSEIITVKQDSSYYEQLFENIISANMNMIRVWGGGIYENDYFYELADKKGVLIWQDFMFACTPYPHDKSFLQNVKKEADYNIKRLRNHASVVLWCGNNEISEGLKYWNWDKKYSAKTMADFRKGYKKLFKNLLPNRVDELDKMKDYIHTSPDSANWGRPNTLGYGDAHYWGVWYGREPFEILNKRVPRFMSEFGFQSFPEMKTIKSFSQKEDWDLESKAMKAHQKSSTGNDAILEYMKRQYVVPKKFEDFVYVSQLLQAHGMQVGIEAHRRNKPKCMGTMYWQLNDSWPVISWSGIDYFGNWKALHYFVKKAYKPATVQAYLNENKIEIFTISDILQDKKGTLKIELLDFYGKKRVVAEKKSVILANQSRKIMELHIGKIVAKNEKKSHLLKISFVTKNKKDTTVITKYFEQPKELNLPKTKISYSLEQNEKGYCLKLTSQKLAKDVMIEVPWHGVKFSDNFFDLLPFETKTVQITNIGQQKLRKSDIKITHLRETY